MALLGRGGQSPGRVAAAALVVAFVVVAAIGVAAGEVGVAVSVEGGASLMGGPLRYHMAAPEEATSDLSTTDQVTGASIDAVTGASRITSAGGVQVHLDHGGRATL